MCDAKEKICKITREIGILAQEKENLEKQIDETLKDVTNVNKEIFEAEREVRRAARNKLAKNCQERFKEEIKKLKKQQKTAEALYETYEEQLQRAMKEYEECGKAIRD